MLASQMVKSSTHFRLGKWSGVHTANHGPLPGGVVPVAPHGTIALGMSNFLTPLPLLRLLRLIPKEAHLNLCRIRRQINPSRGLLNILVMLLVQKMASILTSWQRYSWVQSFWRNSHTLRGKMVNSQLRGFIVNITNSHSLSWGS